MLEFKISRNTLYSCNTDEKIVVIPDNVFNISNKAFYNQQTIEEIIMNDNIRDIDASVFENCINLKNIKFNI